MSKHINVVLGTMVFGARITDLTQVESMLRTFVRLSREHQPQREVMMDTALIYPMVPNAEGLTERILSQQLRALQEQSIVVHSKINPWGDNSMSAEGVVSQMNRILSNLQQDSLELLYLHAPDHRVPIAVTLEAVDRLHREGKVKRFGLSNYSAWQVADIVRTCEARGWLRPSVYQGMYNGISRDVERELFPCLKHFGIPFYAYNATAGGLLTGKHKMEQVPTEGRFTSPVYMQRYWNEKYFGALDRLQAACTAEGVAVADAAHRWLTHHSKLDIERDAIIVGASSAEQLEQNYAAAMAGPLPASIVKAFDEANEVAKPVWPSYFR